MTLVKVYGVSPVHMCTRIRPAVLQIEETAPSRYDVVWRRPLLSGQRLPIALRLPNEVRNLREPMRDFYDALVERRWRVFNAPRDKRAVYEGRSLPIVSAVRRLCR